ncbi:MAG: hypothetical protein M3209_10995 [Acidobacteriota bacterium]|nr:hypothetical protein [Acidobacteriota bacterium]
MSDNFSIKDAFGLYENGKQRRYNLLFAVNTAVFAIAQFINKERVVNDKFSVLSIFSVGMILFTVVMVIDIFKFGKRYRELVNQLASSDTPNKFKDSIFGGWGKFLLFFLGVLICVGWLMICVSDLKPCPQPTSS